MLQVSDGDQILVLETSAVSSGWKWSKHSLFLAPFRRASDTHIGPGDPDFPLYKPLRKAKNSWAVFREGKEGLCLSSFLLLAT